MSASIPKSEQLNGLGYWINGSLASAIMVVKTQWAYVWKTYLMNGKAYPLAAALANIHWNRLSWAAKTILHTKTFSLLIKEIKNLNWKEIVIGAKACYRGGWTHIYAASLIMGKNFLWQGVLTDIWSNNRQIKLSTTTEFMISLTAGALTSPVTTVIEYTYVQMHDTGENVKQVFKRTMKERGLIGFLRGWGPTSLRATAYSAAIFKLNEFSKELMRRIFPRSWKRHEEISKNVGSSLAGFSCGIATGTIDIIKTRMQTDYKKEVYKTMYKTTCLLHKEGGWRTLTRGTFLRGCLIAFVVKIMDKEKSWLPFYMPSFLFKEEFR